MKEIFIERQKELLRIAVKENDELKECLIEGNSTEPYPGEIYIGVVKNIVPAIKSAFIDIGYKKNAYMYLDTKFKNTNIKKGEELLIQVVKEDVGNKGAKVVNALSIPGRYCVLVTLNKDISFSKKIEDKSIKERIIKHIIKPKDIGIMIRTNAAETSVDIINEEIEKLYSVYNQMCAKAKHSTKPGLIFDDGGILGRVLRDKLDNSSFRIYVDNENDYKFVEDFLDDAVQVKKNLKLHEEGRTLFSYYGIEKEILSLRNNRIYLNCGGYLVIDKTEAMHVIDVNSGKNVKGNSMEKTAYITNYQAAEEIGRQVRLRNLGGIIVVDFIDMDNDNNKQKVMEKLKEGFRDDKSKTVIYPFTELNLVQIARRRMGKSIYDYIEEDCGLCYGKGKRIKLSYLCMLIRNEIIRIDEHRDIKDIHIQLNEIYKKDIEGDILDFVKNINGLDKRIYVTYSSEEQFKVEALIFMNQIQNLHTFKIYE
ncbi:ribonuclease E/G [Clostridium sp. DJ247]|uniref:Rne/Rng family ribonuclease n=1 Tax=Clostridium sp. DJ247 TaxID=2726188 RepID=UPI00162697B7|nr:ribonuclease E/G [Clostridium sp. DJ247]MBC2580633.1 ribonuclease E/G [Clostridium sp. DJ247]